MGIVQRLAQKRTNKLDREYWAGIDDILIAEEQKIDYGMIVLNDHAEHGLAFLTNRRIIKAVWGFDRVARPLSALPFTAVYGAELRGPFLICFTTPPATDGDEWGTTGVEFISNYPRPLIERFFNSFGQAFAVADHPVHVTRP